MKAVKQILQVAFNVSSITYLWDEMGTTMQSIGCSKDLK